MSKYLSQEEIISSKQNRKIEVQFRVGTVNMATFQTTERKIRLAIASPTRYSLKTAIQRKTLCGFIYREKTDLLHGKECWRSDYVNGTYKVM